MSLHSKGRKHNKKRNTGLVYEFLIRHMVDGILRESRLDSDRALSIIKRRFKPGTELYKEWRLVNALVKTSGVDETVANAIIRETRDAVRRYDRVKLDREKSALIKELNHTFGKNFYNSGVPNYKLYATIQTLFEDWRSTGIPNISRIAEYEKKLQECLMIEAPAALEAQPDPEADALVIKLMIEKLNRQYAKKLTSQQRSILGRYTFEGVTDKLKQDLIDLRESTLAALEEYDSRLTEGNLFTRKKISEAKNNIMALDTDRLDDSSIARFLKLCELNEELMK